MRCKACNAMVSAKATEEVDPLCGTCLRAAMEAAYHPNEEYRPGTRWPGVRRVMPDSDEPEVYHD
jgi:uncharacterized protein with PIN domain